MYTMYSARVTPGSDSEAEAWVSRETLYLVQEAESFSSVSGSVMLRSAQQEFLYVALMYRTLKWYLGQVNDPNTSF